MSRQAVLACLIACVLAAGASANRNLQQIPTYSGSNLNIVNSADASSQPGQQQGSFTPVPTQQAQTTGTGPVDPNAQANPTGVQGPAPAAAPPVVLPEAQTPPAQAPQVQLAQAPAPATATPPATPVLSTPAPAPSDPLPTVTAPAPAPESPVLPTVPAPAPQTVLTVPAPAPETLPTAPAPAPVMMLPSLVPVPAPVPAPAPMPFPECGVRPQCRLFIEDMLCCENAGALTSKQHATMRLQCTHPVNYYPKCFNVTGPTNITAFSQFENTTWSPTHMAQVSMLDEYMGNVTIDIEGPRIDANLSADCGLYVSPCMYGDEIIRQVGPVEGLSFTTIGNEDFLDISNSLNDDINNLDSLIMSYPSAPGMCQQQNIGELDAAFYTQDWYNYTMGFQNQCNYTAFEEAVAPLSPPESTVQTSSLG